MIQSILNIHLKPYELIASVIGLIGIISSIIPYLHTKKIEKAQRSIEWKDVQIATKDLAQLVKKQYIPDVIYLPNIKSGIIAHFFLDYFSTYIPIVTGQSILKSKYIKKNLLSVADNESLIFFETKKWYAYIPASILKYKDMNLLIIDDFAMSGDFLCKLIDILVTNGFEESKIKTMCIATTEVALKSQTAPTYYWKCFSTTEIYMPWGKPQ